MFVATNAMEMTTDQNRKRSREDPGFGPTSSSFAEHRSKRVQCLPLRTASTATPEQWPPAAPTRINGVQDDESVPRSHAESWPSIATHDSALHDAMDDEMEMTGMNTNSTGRTATPIQPNFSSNFRGSNQHWAENAGRQGILNMGHQQTGLAPPMEIKSGTSWQMMHQNHSLPSPISESENGAIETPQVTVEPCHAHATAYPAMQHSNAVMDMERLPIPEDNAEAPSPSPPRKGHSRSVHTVNSWTWQPGMKKSFSIGFRSDCEKCRDKVPGHFNHIVIS